MGDRKRPWQRQTGRMNPTLLRQIPLFEGMSDGDLATLSRVATWRLYQRGEEIIEASNARGNVFILVEGAASVGAALPDRAEVDVFSLSAGNVIDLDDLPSAVADVVYAVVTSDEAVICRLPREALHRTLFAKLPGPALLDAQLRKRLAELALLFVEFAFYDAPKRLEHALALRAEADPEHMVWDTHAELGRKIGIRREDVTKLLKPLKARGLIDYEQHRRGIQVLKLEKLARRE